MSDSPDIFDIVKRGYRFTIKPFFKYSHQIKMFEYRNDTTYRHIDQTVAEINWVKRGETLQKYYIISPAHREREVASNPRCIRNSLFELNELLDVINYINDFYFKIQVWREKWQLTISLCTRMRSGKSVCRPWPGRPPKAGPPGPRGRRCGRRSTANSTFNMEPSKSCPFTCTTALKHVTNKHRHQKYFSLFKKNCEQFLETW